MFHKLQSLKNYSFPAPALTKPISTAEKVSYVLLCTLIILFPIVLTFLLFPQVMGTAVDFLVYYDASRRAWAHENVYLYPALQPPYGDSLPFTYTPFASFILIITSILPFWPSYVLWGIACLICLVYCINLFIPAKEFHRPQILLVATALSLLCVQINQHIAYGQIGLLLMAMCYMDIVRSGNSKIARYFPKGALIGIAAAIKLTPGLFLPYFLITKQWKMAFWMTTSGFFATLIPAIIFPEMSIHFWLTEFWQLTSKVALGEFFATAANNSIPGALAALGNSTFIKYLTMGLIALAFIFGLWAAKKKYEQNTRHSGLLAATIVGLVAPMISPVSWVHHWVFLIPALIYLWFTHRKIDHIFTIISGVILAFQGPFLGWLLVDQAKIWFLAIPGIPIRESLLLMSIIAIVLILGNHTEKKLDLLAKKVKPAQ